MCQREGGRLGRRRARYVSRPSPPPAKIFKRRTSAIPIANSAPSPSMANVPSRGRRGPFGGRWPRWAQPASARSRAWTPSAFAARATFFCADRCAASISARMWRSIGSSISMRGCWSGGARTMIAPSCSLSASNGSPPLSPYPWLSIWPRISGGCCPTRLRKTGSLSLS